MAELTPSGLRVLLAVSESGSFTAAAGQLGYTQSAISRQAAALEGVTGQVLFERHRTGVRLTAAGSRLLPRARHIITEVDAALAEAKGSTSGRVRLGAFPVASASVVPRALVQLRAEHPDLVVTLREATTPRLVRSIRAGTLDLALVAQPPPFRPLDAETPALHVSTLLERDLKLAVGMDHPLAGRRVVEVRELTGQVWVASAGADGESLMGVWPGLAECPDIRYVARDWLTKLHLVAAGLAVTTVAPALTMHLPPGVHLVSVHGEPREARRVSLIRMPGQIPPHLSAVAHALSNAARSSTRTIDPPRGALAPA